MGFLRGSVCVDGVDCERRWVRWALRLTGTARGHPGFHGGCAGYLNRRFLPKWDSPNGEGKLATARTTSLLVELVDEAA